MIERAAILGDAKCLRLEATDEPADAFEPGGGGMFDSVNAIIPLPNARPAS